jgi:hypothetical protein
MKLVGSPGQLFLALTPASCPPPFPLPKPKRTDSGPPTNSSTGGGVFADLLDGEKCTHSPVNRRHADLTNFLDHLIRSYLELRGARSTGVLDFGSRNPGAPFLFPARRTACRIRGERTHHSRPNHSGFLGPARLAEPANAAPGLCLPSRTSQVMWPPGPQNIGLSACCAVRNTPYAIRLLTLLRPIFQLEIRQPPKRLIVTHQDCLSLKAWAAIIRSTSSSLLPWVSRDARKGP